jgi:hypothetical protein
MSRPNNIHGPTYVTLHSSFLSSFKQGYTIGCGIQVYIKFNNVLQHLKRPKQKRSFSTVDVQQNRTQRDPGLFHLNNHGMITSARGPKKI